MTHKLYSSILFATLALVLGGCGDATHSDSNAVLDDKTSTVTIPQAFDTRPALPAECPSGGFVFSIFLDQNGNSFLDTAETVVKSQKVCNGGNGTNGSNGSNGNDGSNGSNGQDGHDGVDGANGHSIAFTTVVAPAEICGNGGTVLLMATDVEDSGVYSSEAPNQHSVNICNGSNGSNGTDGQNGHDGTNATAPSYSPVDTILACGNSVAYKEVLLRLQNGMVLGSFSNTTSGDMTRLAFLPDGTFMNTDGSNCVFTLATSPDGHTRSISWYNQVQLTWPMP